MPTKRKTMIDTGAAKGIGAGVTNAFIERGYNVVANSRNITTSAFAPTDQLAVVRGDIGDPSTACAIVSTAIKMFGSIDVVINNAGVYFSKPFTEYTVQDFQKLSRTNLRGYINMTQLAVKQMLKQNSGGSVTCVSSTMVEHPIAGIYRFAPKTRALADQDLAPSYARLLSVDFSRDILPHQANKLLVLCSSGSGWVDLGSTDRVLGLLAKDVNQPAWVRQIQSVSPHVHTSGEVVS